MGTQIKKKIKMTPEFESMLMDLGYEEKKGSDEFIFANDESSSRVHISNVLSSAFNHLIKQLGLTEKKEFKNLRKTYATKCYLKDPLKYFEEIGHTNEYTTLNHYIDMAFVMEEGRKMLYAQKKEEEKVKREKEKKQKKKKGSGKK